MQIEDHWSLDLADTDAEAERRFQLIQTFNDHAKAAEWARAALAGTPAPAPDID
jgi:hypothetical protein